MNRLVTSVILIQAILAWLLRGAAWMREGKSVSGDESLIQLEGAGGPVGRRVEGTVLPGPSALSCPPGSPEWH